MARPRASNSSRRSQVQSAGSSLSPASAKNAVPPPKPAERSRWVQNRTVARAFDRLVARRRGRRRCAARRERSRSGCACCCGRCAARRGSTRRRRSRRSCRVRWPRLTRRTRTCLTALSLSTHQVTLVSSAPRRWLMTRVALAVRDAVLRLGVAGRRRRHAPGLAACAGPAARTTRRPGRRRRRSTTA